MGQVRIGVSGWSYGRWRGDFYPEGLRQRDELSYIASQLNSAEINSSFYSLKTPSVYTAWSTATPDGFCFAVKGSRYITHLKQLHDPVPPLSNFYASGPLQLARKLGPFLWQLPERLHFDAGRLEGFFGALPRTIGEAY